MRKRKGRLMLHRETLLNLQSPEVRQAKGGESFFCAPSAVKSVCMTYCPDFTCTRPVVDPVQLHDV